MVSRRELERIARRYDTAMSFAMLRALGISVRRRIRVPAIVPASYDSRWEGMREARMNRPTDGWNV